MTRTQDSAWQDFWADNARQGGGGCLPGRWQAIEDAQRKVWTQFASDLPRKARILDLATGDGRVMAWLLKARPDVKPVGIDFAPELPKPPAGTKVYAGVAMEDMPFRDDQFSAAISQFGFEYGDIPGAAAELARVVEPGGKIGLITHRKDGPILAHNVSRREQIEWALVEQDIVETAKRSLSMRAAGISAIPQKIQQAPQLGANKYGQQSAAWEIAEAVRQSLDLGRRDHPANVAKLLDTIAAKANNELGRIASLAGACETTAGASAFEAALNKGGLKQISITSIETKDEARPIADFRVLRHTD